ncbi:uncharacterized protein F5147DRAFT_771379 [Suillus discolor]|uniref:Uncharacterized protein n=1 Tax=Suillus discolor TaxID=1912936 RepID=A0A9P7FD62_9AGAM|nr:uncharacterized protein F5147DRAFT_771379 [Suillus discolor]KAG2112323.1 hypothetical protein F5147DRAFT_771379 [Suillus discolor]
MLLEERYEGARMCYSQDGPTFLDVFDADEYAEYREDNLFYPSASKEEWEITSPGKYQSSHSAELIPTFTPCSDSKVTPFIQQR